METKEQAFAAEIFDTFVEICKKYNIKFETVRSTTDINFNQEFGAEMQKMGLWTPEITKIVNKTRGNVDMIPNLPQEMKDKYRGKVDFGGKL
jgi:hypothetical protein